MFNNPSAEHRKEDPNPTDLLAAKATTQDNKEPQKGASYEAYKEVVRHLPRTDTARRASAYWNEVEKRMKAADKDANSHKEETNAVSTHTLK